MKKEEREWVQIVSASESPIITRQNPTVVYVPGFQLIFNNGEGFFPCMANM